MKKAKRRMMARKGKMIRTMMTRERDSLTSLNLQRGRTVRKMPHTARHRAQRAAGIGAACTVSRSSTWTPIVQVEREDYSDAIRLLDAAT